MLTRQLLLASVAAARVMHSLPGVPEGWSMVREASAADPVTLRIALRQQYADELEQMVFNVSTPGHPDYGHHLTREALRSLTAPSAESVTSVAAWLAAYGIAAPAIDNDWVLFQTTAGLAGDLLNTTFSWYQYNDDSNSRPKLRTLQYSLPDSLVEHIDMVQPTTRFGQLATHRSTIFDMHPATDEDLASLEAAFSASAAAKGAADDTAAASDDTCSSRVTPACLKSLYGINYTVTDTTNNRVAYSSYLDEYSHYEDLQKFESKFVPSAVGQNFTVELINGGQNNQTYDGDSGEANLDVQYILGISSPIPITEYSTGGLGPLVPTVDEPTQPGDNEPYMDFLTYILGLDDDQLPQTLSTSYGEEEQSVPPEFAYKVCNMFMQLGARGVSVLFSSGDSGPGSSCVRMSDNKPYFQPTFPAGCPYVTAVGATYKTGPEQAVPFSSGGFSTLHARPRWQNCAVKKYLRAIGGTYSDYFNASGRGIPDVAAQGNAFYVYDKGELTLLSGTSASAPVFSGVIALLNAARRSTGLSPLGFLNPWLYQNPDALNDITAGYSSGCRNKTYFASTAHWNATAGWDPVTGLGTPNFPALLAAAAPGVKNV